MEPSREHLRQAIRSYEDIEAYQRAMALLVPAHRLASTFPAFERYELASQIRRATKSVPTNIAAGYAKRRSAKEFTAYLMSALASANEMDVHLKVATHLGYASPDEAQHLIEGYQIIGRQLNKLISSWRKFDTPASSFQPPGDH